MCVLNAKCAKHYFSALQLYVIRRVVRKIENKLVRSEAEWMKRKGRVGAPEWRGR